MNVLFCGPDDLLVRMANQTCGQRWDIFRAGNSEGVKDFVGTHRFQAALFGLVADDPDLRRMIRFAKNRLDIPVVIGLLPGQETRDAMDTLPSGLDIALTGCADDRFIKLQCDALMRLAHHAASPDITSGNVTYHSSTDVFSVHGRAFRLPYKKHKLLQLLFLEQGRVVSNQMVFDHLYGWEEPPNAKIVDVYICQIRRARRDAGATDDCIRTVWGAGYSVDARDHDRQPDSDGGSRRALTAAVLPAATTPQG